jgi:hypothetical protein
VEVVPGMLRTIAACGHASNRRPYFPSERHQPGDCKFIIGSLKRQTDVVSDRGPDKLNEKVVKI